MDPSQLRRPRFMQQSLIWRELLVTLAPPKSSEFLELLHPQNLVGQLELRISANSVGLYPQPPTSINSDLLAAQAMLPQPPPNTTDGLICLLSGPLDDFLKYSRQEQSKWLIDIAHDICDPASLRGSLFVWNVGMQQWRLVAHTEPLTASTYLYNVPVGVIVGLSKMSICTGKSITTTTGHASTMADRVKRRDGVCWASGIRYPLVNSHICPKRTYGRPSCPYHISRFHISIDSHSGSVYL